MSQRNLQEKANNYVMTGSGVRGGKAMVRNIINVISSET